MKNSRPTKSNKGGRNLFCRHYDHCLDYAIEMAWNSWNCTKCDFKNKVSENTVGMQVSSEDIVYYEFGNGFSGVDLENIGGF
jgi:hypothetical protein